MRDAAHRSEFVSLMAVRVDAVEKVENYTACMDTSLAIRIRNTRAVAHETATRRKFTVERN
jgi:hypothetical protein